MKIDLYNVFMQFWFVFLHLQWYKSKQCEEACHCYAFALLDCKILNKVRRKYSLLFPYISLNDNKWCILLHASQFDSNTRVTTKNTELSPSSTTGTWHRARMCTVLLNVPTAICLIVRNTVQMYKTRVDFTVLHTVLLLKIID